jgi:hypothetical protein
VALLGSSPARGSGDQADSGLSIGRLDEISCGNDMVVEAA